MRLRFSVLALLATALPLAAQPAPTPQDDLVAEYYIETGQLRVALGQQMKATLEARREIEKLKAAAKPAEETK
jgi:hypothetical protein